MNLALCVAAHDAIFSDGARNGWTDGKLYCHGYTLGEEYVLADEAATDKRLPNEVRASWEAGYAHGYRRAAEGEELEPEHARRGAELAERFQ